MKTTIPRSELVRHRKAFKVAKPDKKTASSSIVTLTVEEGLSVTSKGFRQKLECDPIEWGSITMPYNIWDRLLQYLRRVPDKRITISAKDGQIEFQQLTISNKNIKSMRPDKLVLEIPVNASELDIIRFAFLHGTERFKSSGNWKLLRHAFDELSKKIDEASSCLQECGVQPIDIARVVAKKLDIKDQQKFIDILFTEE